MRNGTPFKETSIIKEFCIISDSNPGLAGNDHVDMGEISHHLGKITDRAGPEFLTSGL